MSKKSWIDQWHEFWDGPPVDVVPVKIPGVKEPVAMVKPREEALPPAKKPTRKPATRPAKRVARSGKKAKRK